MAITTKDIGHYLLAISEANELLIELQLAFQKRTEFKQVSHGFDLRRLATGCLIDAFVEIELGDTSAYCWWLEIRFEGNNWAIETSVQKTEDGQQHLHSRLAEFTGSEAEDFTGKLKIVREAIAESAKQF